MLTLVNIYLWLGPVLIALLLGYVSYNIYKGHRTNKEKEGR